MPITAMAFNRDQETFSLLANRPCWEYPGLIHEGKPLHHRVHASVVFKGVHKVERKKFHPTGALRTLSFLTALPEEIGHRKSPGLRLYFAGGYEMRLQLRTLHCHLGDLDQPWPTRSHPVHIHEHIS